MKNHKRFSGKIYFEEFQQKYFFEKEEVEDHLYTEIVTFIQEELKIERMSAPMVRTSLEMIGRRNKRNTRKEWLESLKWDGVERIEESMLIYFNAKCDNNKDKYEYLQAVGKNFWLSLAAMGMKPGSKVDFMLILEGSQGTKKSSVIKMIAKGGYRQPSCSIRNMEAFMSSIEGSSIVEIAELDSFRGADVNAMKRIVSSEDDNIKKLYKDSKDRPRSFIFMGTTNDAEYLRDETGNRRFIPVEVGHIDIDKVERDLDQLYAEAVHRYKAGEPWWEFPKYAEVIQKLKLDEDPWTPDVEDYLDRTSVKNKGYVTINEIFSNVLSKDDNSGGIPMYTKERDNNKKNRVAKILRGLNYICKVEWIPEKNKSLRVYRQRP